MTRTNYQKLHNLLLLLKLTGQSYLSVIGYTLHLILPNVFKYITTGNKNCIKYIRSGVYGKEAK